MSSTIYVNNLTTASGSTITVPTGKKLVVTDAGGVQVPHMVGQMVQSGTIRFYTNSASATCYLIQTILFQLHQLRQVVKF